jgi:hypothetical protein
VEDMGLDEKEAMTLEKLKALEIDLHSELMKSCRKYINKIGIVTIIGVLDIVKQEVIELDKAMKTNIGKQPEEGQEENKNDFF